MPARILGMIGVKPPANRTVHVIDGAISPEWIAQTCREHEAAGYDEVLVGYHSVSADGFGVALYGACNTERLSFLLAHRPGRILPALAARKIATLDQLAKGRLSVHTIIGGSDAEQQSEGDFSGKDERYERGAEYLDVMRRIWTANEPFDYDGRFYKLRGAISEIKCVQKPYPRLFFGGSSEGALEMGAAHCDYAAMFGEPLKETAERIADFQARCARHGRVGKFNMSFRPVIADTEGKAWDKARSILEFVKDTTTTKKSPTSLGGQRLVDIAARGELHDERLWTPVAGATGGEGNTTCLVGTPQQVAEALMKYYDLGVTSFLLRGFDPNLDVSEFGRELIPRVRAAALERDRANGMTEEAARRLAA